MTKFYKLILVCCAALFLTACAHPDMIKLNDTYDHTVKELGVPDSTTRLPDGSIRIVYSMQPMGQTSYVMIFNPEGNPDSRWPYGSTLTTRMIKFCVTF